VRSGADITGDVAIDMAGDVASDISSTTHKWMGLIQSRPDFSPTFIIS